MARNLAGWTCALIGTMALGAPAAHAAAPPGESARVAAFQAPTAGAQDGGAGVYAQRVGGPALVSIDAATRFEPASAMKIIIAAAAERQGLAYGSNLPQAYKYPNGFNRTSADDPDGTFPNMCINPADELPGNERPGITGNFAQGEMMVVSDNVLTRTMLLAVGGLRGLDSTIAAAGMTATTIGQDEIGCGFKNGKANKTTLQDLARIWERIEADRAFMSVPQRTHLFKTMGAELPAANNRRTAGAGAPTQALFDIIEEEAGPTKLRVAGSVKNWLYNGLGLAVKGGSYQISCGPGNDECPVAGRLFRIRSLAGLQRIPYHVPGGADESRVYTVAARTSRSCPDGDAACATRVEEANNRAWSESLRSVVRDALLSKQFPDDAVPVARLAGPDTAVAGTPVSFDASGSSDAEGAIARVDWAFGDGATTQGATVTHTFAAPGTYLVEAGATDGIGKNDTARKTVTVVAPPPATDGGGGGGGGQGSGAGPGAPAGPAGPAGPVADAPTLAVTAPARVKRGRALAVRVTTGRAATVVVRVQRSVAGRRKGKRCVAPGKAKRGKRCTRTVDAAVVRRVVEAGGTTIRVATRRLKPGTYRLAVTAPGAPARTLKLRVDR